MKNSSSVSATKLRRKTERDPHLALILKRLRHEALYNKQEVIVDCSWYTGVGIHENSDRHYLSQPADPKRVSQWISTQLADGSWPDIPYWPQKKDSPWWVTAPQTHICWLLALSEAWHHRDSPHRSNAELLQTIVRGLEFWCLHDFSTLGWWWTQIGLPRWLCRIIALMEQSLPQAVITKSLEIIGRADGPTPWGKSLVGTAQNQVWAAENVFILACLENNPNRARSAVDIIINEITVRPDWGEGLQADYSFQQHGNTLYSGGYGYYFAVDIPRLAHLVHNTPYALPQAALNHITRYLLDHQRLITRSTNYAYTAVGRLIARQGDTAWLLPNAYRALARLPLTTPLQTLAANTAAALDGDVTAAKHAFYGNSCFWRSDFMAHQHPDYHASVKLHSDRLLNNDVPCNDEGLQSHHLSDGAFCLMRHGREYANLFPAWKWHRIPGTTAIQLRSRLTTATPIPTAGRRPFAGGVSNGTTGCIGYDFATAADPAAADELEARKAWFFLDDSIVWLGAAINGHTNAPVITTINQCRGFGNVTIGSQKTSQRIRSGKFSSNRINWVHHDRVGYVILTPGRVEGSIERVVGNWNTINGQIKNRPVHENLFYLGLPHGRQPKDATYACALLPNKTPTQTARWSASPPLQIIANNKEIQAIWLNQTQTLYAIFYSAGTLTIPQTGTIAVDRPCALLLTIVNDSTPTIHASAPDHSSGKLTITTSGSAFGATKPQNYTITLPKKPYAGQTATLS